MNTKNNQIFFVVPRLIEQPTWGGDYILEYKNWSGKKPFGGLKIGQSYELFSGSRLRSDINSSDDPSFAGELAYASDCENTDYQEDPEKLTSLHSLLSTDEESIIGPAGMKLNNKLVLIKFTQAKGNSFQLHKRESIKSDKWLAKPESWYYFEPGLLTLGLKRNVNINDYKKSCQAIDEEMKKISAQVKNGEISISDAKKIAESIKNKFNPWQYVNLVEANKDDLIDLSIGSLHHSWEENESKFPLGNIVYELCYDIMDPVSSIRSFDKCKMKDDGSLRKVDIEDYFSFIDTDEKINDPEAQRVKPETIFSDDAAMIQSFLRTPYYAMDRITLGGSYAGEHSSCRDSYHHLFVKEGEVVITCNVNEIKLTKGHSCFIPAAVGEYQLNSNGETQILKTFIK